MKNTKPVEKRKQTKTILETKWTSTGQIPESNLFDKPLCPGKKNG